MRFFFVTLLFFVGCVGGLKSTGIRLGIDPNWYPLDFGLQSSYINGFTEELLLDIALETKTDYIRQLGNSETLFSNLQSGQHDAVLTSLPPHNFNLAKYDFSRNFLELGAVLVVPASARYDELAQLNGRSVGTISNDQTVLLLQAYPEIVMRSYFSIPELLNAVVAGEIQGALLARIPASTYVRDLYLGQLKIVGKPLTQEGLHLITLKGRHPQIIKQFDRALDVLNKKKMALLLRKWQLD